MIHAVWTVPSPTVGKIVLEPVRKKIPPVVDFTANLTEGSLPVAVRFTGLSSADPTSWQWDIGNDGTWESGERNFTYLFADFIGNEPRPVTIALNVTDVNGSNISVKQDLFTEYPLEPLFETNVTQGTVPLEVRFTDRSFNGTPSSWNWSFGDGSTSDLADPVHRYSEAGSYDIVLNVSNAYSFGTIRKAGHIHADLPAVANFTANRTDGEIPFAVVFTDTSDELPVA